MTNPNPRMDQLVSPLARWHEKRRALAAMPKRGPSILTLRDADLPPVPRVADVLSALSESTGLPVKDLIGRSRGKEWASIRHAGYWMAKRLTGKSVTIIADMFNRDHSTVLYGIKKVDSCHEPYASVINETMALLRARAAA